MVRSYKVQKSDLNNDLSKTVNPKANASLLDKNCKIQQRKEE
jgi:hypothetical protein